MDYMNNCKAEYRTGIIKKVGNIKCFVSVSQKTATSLYGHFFIEAARAEG